MFAVIRTGGKQYKVTSGAVVTVEKLNGEPGSSIAFSDVVMMGETVGQPVVTGVSVVGEVLRQFKGDKITVFKKRRRKNYRRRRGHRQALTLVRITGLAAEAEAV
ncbi:LSU ribosomal protein L21p [invertebrate metagenome]|uniref:LSU ribosomal protein L21p n=1 Tax=invertebrate metagenome TaxID=1711999 RepID=A0A484H5M4_9ZZZZ